MSKKYLGLISKESGDDWKFGNIRIDSSSGSLQYKNLTGLTTDIFDVITIDNSDELNRLAKLSDLHDILEKRNFNILDCKAVLNEGNNGTLAFIEYGEGGTISGYNRIYSPSISKKDYDSINSHFEYIDSISWNEIPFYQKEVEKLDRKTWVENNDFKGVANMNISDPKEESTKFYNFRMIRNFITKSTTVNVLTIGGSIYTDTINLNTVRSSISGNDESVKTSKITVQYSNKSGVVSVKDFIFPISENFKTKFDEIEIEYSNGCIRLFPLSDNVVECIISQCLLFYDRIL